LPRCHLFFEGSPGYSLAENSHFYLLLTENIRYTDEQMAKWMTLEEVSEYLSTSPSTVYKLKARGKLRGYRVGRNLRFDRDEVDADVKKTQSHASFRGKRLERN
jgi:excisionase family DNA binding protein